MRNAKLTQSVILSPSTDGRRIPIRLQNLMGFFATLRMTKVAFNPWRRQTGQALVTLLFFMIIAITITSAAVVILITNSLSAQKLEQGTISYYVAESGADNAILRLIRDPNYTGETLIIDGATVVSTVSNSGSVYTVTSDATSGNFKRTIQVEASFVNNILTISSWKEVF